jgi:cell division protease FtsH
MRKNFKLVSARKPDASRDRSPEVYSAGQDPESVNVSSMSLVLQQARIGLECISVNLWNGKVSEKSRTGQRGRGEALNNMFKNLAVWLVIGLVLMTVFNQFNNRQVTQSSMEYSQFIEEVGKGTIAKVVIEGRVLKATTTDGRKLTSYAPPDLWMVSDLLKHGVKIEAKPEEEQSFLMSIFVSWFPMLLLIGVWIFFMRQMQGGGRGGAFSFGKSKARLLDESTNTITFADVAGCDEAKEEVSELVDFLRDPSKFQKLGGRIPKGVLLVGNPGTGKTCWPRRLPARPRCLSSRFPVPTSSRCSSVSVRRAFATCSRTPKKHAPCIIFIDELDAVGRQRGAGLGGGNDEREQTLNQMLVEMDGFEGSVGVIVIAATNRPDVLDPALMRPGRFDRQVVVPLPDIRGREQISWCICARCRCRPTSRRTSSPAGHPDFPGPTWPTWLTKRPCSRRAATSAWSTWKTSKRPRTRS